MKKLRIILILFIAIAHALSIKAQDKLKSEGISNSKNEIKFNISNPGLFSLIDLSYERLIQNQSSLGITCLLNLGDSFEPDYSIAPHYRKYFSETGTREFFLEGFGMFTYTDLNNIVSISENYVGDFALGLSVGWKFVTRNGFTTEAYFGVGRNLLNKEYTSQLVLRGGLALGYRF